MYAALARDPCLSLHHPEAVRALCPILQPAEPLEPEGAALGAASPGGVSPERLGNIWKKMREIYLCVVRSADPSRSHMPQRVTRNTRPRPKSRLLRARRGGSYKNVCSLIRPHV